VDITEFLLFGVNEVLNTYQKASMQAQH